MPVTVTPKTTAKRRPPAKRKTTAPSSEPDNMWSRLAKVCDPMSPSVAKYFLKFEFPDADHRRMAELNQLANEGLLTPDQRTELEDYIRIGSFLSILKLKARQVLAKHGR